MAGIKQGKEKWRAKAYQAANSQTKFVGMTEQFAASLEAQGVTVGPETRARYRGGIRGNAQPREPYRGDIAKGADKWESNYAKAMAR